MKVLCRIIVILCALLICSGCSRQGPRHLPGQKPGANAGLPLIAVSIPPQAWFVSRIGGDGWRTLVLAGPGQNPHSYEPGVKQLRNLAEAQAWILCGAEFEISLLPKIKRLFPNLPIVDGTAGVVFREALDDDEGEAAHDAHSPLRVDRHTWLGSQPAKILGAHVRDTLSRIDPAGAEQYAARYEALAREIDAEFAELRVGLAPLEGRNVFVYHPAFGYFLDEFGIHQQAVETGGKEPGPRDLNRLIALAKREQAAAIFVQTQFPANAAKTVADAVGAELIGLDPLAEDWLANVRLMGEVLKAAAGAASAASVPAPDSSIAGEAQ